MKLTIKYKCSECGRDETATSAQQRKWRSSCRKCYQSRDAITIAWFDDKKKEIVLDDPTEDAHCTKCGDEVLGDEDGLCVRCV